MIVIFSLLLLSQTIKSHTVEVCNVVAAGGRTVDLYAGTYHGITEINSRGGVSGGILLTDPGGVQRRYNFASIEPDNNQEKPPSCLLPGVSCDCDRCPNYYNSNGIQNWQKVTISGLADGVYTVRSTCDHAIECPWGGCGDRQFTIKGSVVVPQLCPYYLYFDDGIARTKSEAEQKCVDMGTTLASITSGDELQCAVTAVGTDSAPWVGMKSIDDHGDWEYTDGATCPLSTDWKCIDSFAWINGRPLCISTENGAYCANLRPSANGGRLYNDIPCSSTLTAILCNDPTYVRPAAKTEPVKVVNDYDMVKNSNNLLSSLSATTMIIGFAVFIMFIVLINAFICYWCLAKNNNKNINKNINDDQI